MLKHEELTNQIIGAAIEVHRELGAGLLESVYEQCLCHEFALRKVEFQRQVEVPIRYKDVKLESGFRLDFIMENKVVVELKAVEKIEPVHEAQLLTYTKLVELNVGLLINFNVPVLKNGIIRRVL